MNDSTYSITLQSMTMHSIVDELTSSAVGSPEKNCETGEESSSASQLHQDAAEEIVSSLRKDTILFKSLLFRPTTIARKYRSSSTKTMPMITAAALLLLLLQQPCRPKAFSTDTYTSSSRSVMRRVSTYFSTSSAVIPPLQVASINPHGARNDGEIDSASIAQKMVSSSKSKLTSPKPTTCNSTIATSFASAVDFDWRFIAEQVFELDTRPIILFDGVCNLCNGGVNFAMDHDSQAKFRYASLQSKVAQSLLIREGKHPTQTQNIVLVTSDTAYYKSQAVAKICAQLDWPILQAVGRIGQVTPKALREPIYKFISRNRFVLGENDSCRLDLDGEYNGRFVSDPTATKSAKNNQSSS
jgi:predicted DCC family thiol-disulfide oxidoreductase YuxK